MRHGVGNTGVVIENSIFRGYTDDSEGRMGTIEPNGIGVRASYNTGFYNGDAAMSFTNVVRNCYRCWSILSVLDIRMVNALYDTFDPRLIYFHFFYLICSCVG